MESLVSVPGTGLGCMARRRERWDCTGGVCGEALRCNCTGMLHQSLVFLGESDSPATCRASALINKKEEIIPKGSRGMRCIRTFARAGSRLLRVPVWFLSVARQKRDQSVGHWQPVPCWGQEARVRGAPGARGIPGFAQ